MKLQLRDYQLKAIQDLRKSFAGGKRSPMFVCPTGSGKTVTYSAITEGAASRGKRVLILEHRKELISQCSLALARLDVHHQIIAPPDTIAGIRKQHFAKLNESMLRNGAHVAVASVQTLVRRFDTLQKFNPDLIIIDEADLAAAKSWTDIIERCPNAKLLGVTATPCRSDNKPLDAIFDDLILGPSVADLISWGNLARPRVFAPPVKFSLDNVHMSGGDFNAQELAEVLDKPTITGDAIKHYRELAHNKPAIVFCSSVKHAEHVAADFCAAGYRFEVVTGSMDGADRDDRIQGLASGKYHGIVTVDVVSRGTDIPVAEVAILLRPTQSLALNLQQVGRVLRPADGKEFGLILDHVGNVLRFGMPDADREWSLAGRKKRSRGAAENDPSLRVVQCPKCFMAHDPLPRCPSCGHVYEIKGRQPNIVDGQLQEITAEAAPVPIRTGKLATIEEMKAAGLSTGRASHILHAREEKDRMRRELHELMTRYAKQSRELPAMVFGFGFSDIRDMKPKQLRESIARVSEALLMASGEAVTA